MSIRYKIVPRQAQYYLDAAEMLGLIEASGRKVSLTALGRRFIELTYQERKEVLMEQVLSLPVFQKLIIALMVSKSHVLDPSQIKEIVSVQSRLSDSTISRRIQTLIEWFSWISGEVGVFDTRDRTLRLALL